MDQWKIDTPTFPSFSNNNVGINHTFKTFPFIFCGKSALFQWLVITFGEKAGWKFVFVCFLFVNQVKLLLAVLNWSDQNSSGRFSNFMICFPNLKFHMPASLWYLMLCWIIYQPRDGIQNLDLQECWQHHYVCGRKYLQINCRCCCQAFRILCPIFSFILLLTDSTTTNHHFERVFSKKNSCRIAMHGFCPKKYIYFI